MGSREAAFAHALRQALSLPPAEAGGFDPFCNPIPAVKPCERRVLAGTAC